MQKLRFTRMFSDYKMNIISRRFCSKGKSGFAELISIY